MKMKSMSSMQKVATLSMVFMSTTSWRRSAGMKRTSLSTRSSRKVRSTDSPPSACPTISHTLGAGAGGGTSRVRAAYSRPTLGHPLPRGRNESPEPPPPLLSPNWEQVRLHQSVGVAEGWWWQTRLSAFPGCLACLLSLGWGPP